ncbi:HEAT repeat domain-containing protein [Corallococcus sp. CA053C]|uniref:HEAT repeat domain-containing protein n=1 Tax=Corallococcus sp. CA053C TaxID=2316732 RepID=UPI000EA3C878|nr:HEAT repeat domain-containing protein [Corallococcus sp. CA053C]RKH05002.1 HEAT repeat domain-containing protein [Corallococcus sp. CA053C]
MTSRPSIKVALAGLLLLLVAVGVVLWRGTARSDDAARPPPGTPGPSATTAGASGSGAPVAAAPGARPPPREQIPMPGCWDGLAALDRDATLDSLHAAVAAAIQSRDTALVAYLQERLTELVGNDPDRALQLVTWAMKSAPPEPAIYLEALKAAPAVRHPRVTEKLVAVAEDKSLAAPDRASALDALETQHRFTPETRGRLKAIALDDSADSAAWMAARTLGRVMKEDYTRTGTYAPYWKDLLDIGTTSEDTAVRLLALEMPSYSDPLLDSDSIDVLAKVMRTDKERDVREMAAFRLAVTEDPQKALAAFRSAFDGEQDVCVRWAFLRFAVRAAGADALPLVEEFARKDPRLRQDYLDFKALYATGTTDFARIWLGKKEHHDCVVEEGAPH